VQIDLDERTAAAEPTGRGGMSPAGVEGVTRALVRCDHLSFAGVMAVAPRGGDAASAFARLVRISLDLRARHPDARIISAGMSGDLEAAVANGATHLRVGAALLGSRPPLG